MSERISGTESVFLLDILLWKREKVQYILTTKVRILDSKSKSKKWKKPNVEI